MSSASLVSHPAGFAPNPVIIKGHGRPVVYLHGPFGQEWSTFLDGLTDMRKIYAPAHPGSIEPADLNALDSFSDLVLYYDDLFDALGLEELDLIGHSFGGMVAAEYAAVYPSRVKKLILIDAMGLWDDDHPVEDHFLASDETRLQLLYHDRGNPAVVEKLRLPASEDEARAAFIATTEALASSSHFIHPIPERGLIKRLRRIAAETLIIWGREDRLVPAFYAKAFADKISGARVEIVADAGHLPQLEQSAQVAELVRAFLK
jgi:pimeloyl-ACP methyl ester carboxylesterase